MVLSTLVLGVRQIYLAMTAVSTVLSLGWWLDKICCCFQCHSEVEDLRGLAAKLDNIFNLYNLMVTLLYKTRFIPGGALCFTVENVQRAAVGNQPFTSLLKGCRRSRNAIQNTRDFPIFTNDDTPKITQELVNISPTSFPSLPAIADEIFEPMATKHRNHGNHPRKGQSWDRVLSLIDLTWLLNIYIYTYIHTYIYIYIYVYIYTRIHVYIYII